MNKPAFSFVAVVALTLMSRVANSECVDRGFSEIETQVLNAYIAYYGRPADPGGLEFWADRLESKGGNLASIIEAFGISQEFDDRFGDLSPEDLITNLYQQLFNRDPEDGGFQFWLGQFTSGARTLQDIALAILDGAQNEDLDIVTNRNLAARHFVSELECANIALPDSIYNSLLMPVNEMSSSTTAACDLVDNTIESLLGTQTDCSSDLPDGPTQSVERIQPPIATDLNPAPDIVEVDLSGCLDPGSSLQAVRVDPTSGTVALRRMRLTIHGAVF